MKTNNLGWFSIFRLGLVQASLGAIVVLTTSTLNRVMVLEVGLAAMIPGALVTLHHAMQMLRPRMGHGSDHGQRRTPWIIGGMATLALGGVLAAAGTALMKGDLALGLAVGAVGFTLIGAGVSAAGTSLLVLMAKRVHAQRRAAAATIVWMMMIMGFAVTAGSAGRLLDPYTPLRLVQVAAGVSLLAFLLSLISIWGLEGDDAQPEATPEARPPFREALKQVWQESDARRFTLFVAISMLSYSAQDLVLEPFAGAHFGFTPGETTKLSGVQHGGVFAGMLLVALATTLLRSTPAASLKKWVVGGCLASAIAMGGLVAGGLQSGPWPVRANVFLLGLANGVFSIAAIGAMMALASQGRGAREGVRMGLWGAAQAIAFGAGGFVGTVIVDAAKYLGFAPGPAAAVVFALEVVGFLAAHWIALSVNFEKPAEPATVTPAQGTAVHQPA
ncbi:MAG: BCD family MFS transporter [Myxococcaceae bacterium]|jgi:BCD family chlorophyll transporter-like MFS transporter|nr:BCD family MFS transporter [Myxococcaceae bacterium]MCA3012449.1 BCD family MFS transporter [Myxococcaceae bacterium]